MVDIYRHENRFLEEFASMTRIDAFRERFSSLPIEAIDVWKNEIERLEEIITLGCPVRSLESAMEAEATEEEWDFYLDLLSMFRQKLSPLKAYLNHPDFSQMGDRIHRRHILLYAHYLETVATNKTPLGGSLRRHTCKIMPMNLEEIVQNLGGDKKILVEYIPPSGRHMAHVGLKDNKVVCLSDRDCPEADIYPGHLYQGVLFTPISTI